MEVSVLVERLNGDGYRATTLTPAPLVAEGKTPAEALTQIGELVRGRSAVW